ncbi:MAG: leucine-rich repeat domain-containing protein [Verrucomicrobiota bacterium]
MKNRIVCGVVVLLASLLAAPATQAQFAYTTNNGTIIITGYTGSGGAVIIPAEIADLPVTSIGDWAFYSTGVINVTIADTVTNIGDGAFFDCESLTNIAIGANVASIGDWAFAFCPSLTNVNFRGNPPGLGGTNVFYGDAATVNYLPGTAGWGPMFGGLGTVLWNPPVPYRYTTNNGTILINRYTGSGGEVVIPTTISFLPVTGIADRAFYSTGVINVTIADTVTNIGDGAFFDCESLTNIAIGANVASIGDWAFENCTGLGSVTIPNSVTNIGISAFVICVSLIAINVDAQNAFYSSLNGVLFDKAQSTLVEYPGGKIGSYSVPGTVTSIAQYAFATCTNLTRITIPASVTNIGDLAFLECYYLTTATVASGMLTFGESAFGGCLRLTTVYFQGNAPNADDSLFSTAGAVNEPGTVYYLPGTSGWSNSCGGEPAVLWNPLIQTADGGFGVRTNQFGFNITGTTNIPIVVQAADNLANPVWTSLQALTLTNGSYYFSEPFQPASPARFYRITSQ